MGIQNTFAIFKNRNYLRLFLAMFTSQLGSIIGMIAFTFYLLDRFGDKPYYASITEMMYSLPTLVVFFLVGVLADRMDRQKIAMYSDWICALFTILFLAAIWVGWMPLIFTILFLRSAVSKFFQPAQSSLVQGILKKDEYTVAAGLNQMLQSIFMLFGVGFGALSYWFLGVQGAILLDAASFVISGLLIHSCKFSEEVRLPNGRSTWKDLNLQLVMRDFKSGFYYILANPLLLSLIIGFFMFGIINGGFSVMPMFILKYKLAPETYEEMTFWMSIAFGAGILAGSMFAPVLAKKIKLYQMIILGIINSALFTGLIALAPNLWILFAFEFFLAFCIPFINVGLGGWLPQIIDPKMMGRVQGLVNPLMMLFQSLTLGVISIVFPVYVGVEALYYGIALAMLMVSIYYVIVLPKFEKRQDLYHNTKMNETESIADPAAI